MTSDIFADLHNHTTCSDGDFSPENMVKAAKKLGIKAIGITDHDTLKGLGPALEAGDVQKTEVVPGVEVSVSFKRPYFIGTLHLLVYFSRQRIMDNFFVTAFENLLAQGRGEGLVRARIEQINLNFGPDSQNPLLKRNLVFRDISSYSNNATRRHFALALADKLDIDDPKIINSIIGNNSPAYVASGIGLDRVAKFIKKHEVTAVLAHPAAGSFPGRGHYKEVLPSLDIVEKIFPEFIEAGIGGIEVNYPGHIREHRDILLSWADAHNLCITGGSDCHDAIERPIGVAGISESEFEIFKAKLR